MKQHCKESCKRNERGNDNQSKPATVSVLDPLNLTQEGTKFLPRFLLLYNVHILYMSLNSKDWLFF